MNEAEASARWRRIEEFDFDEPGVGLTFAGRLARENGWSIGLSRRAMREYRRFLFLALTAGHPVTPSDAVDQVWHLHLTYTRSYWQGMCRDILGRPLHHEPTRGGAAEGAKFEDWYERTRASYARAFGEPAPSDLWPPPEVRFGTDLRYVRVNRARHWIIPRPRWVLPEGLGWLGRRGRAAGLAVMATAAAGCGMMYRVPPFTFDGGVFLVFFPFFAAVVFGLAGWLRGMLGRGGSGSPRVGVEAGATPDPYLVAFLAGGQARAVQAAVVALVAGKAARDLAGNGSLVLGPSALPAGAHPFEKAVHACLDPVQGQTIRDLARATRAMGLVLRDGLEERGWWLTRSQATRATLLPGLLAALVPALAAVRTWQGVATEHPSGFIGAGAVLTAILAVVFFGRPPGRSRAGSVALARWRAEHRARRAAEPVAGAGSSGAEATLGSRAGVGLVGAAALLPLAVGLFGSTALAGTELDRLRRTLRPADQASGGCGTGTGCGSDGGGGGGDGGGGGGGCGGCGGGGGD
jgi:uncharacterized protein (TIGR04222 family)